MTANDGAYKAGGVQSLAPVRRVGRISQELVYASFGHRKSLIQESKVLGTRSMHGEINVQGKMLKRCGPAKYSRETFSPAENVHAERCREMRIRCNEDPSTMRARRILHIMMGGKRLL
jgi:hypothetical protein